MSASAMRIGTSHRRYAKAFMALSENAAAAREMISELRRIEDAMESSPLLRGTLASPLVDKAKKIAVCRDIGAALGLSRRSQRAWELLVQRGRSDEVPGIVWQFERLVDLAEGKDRAQVSTATALDTDTRTQVKARLDALSGKDVLCSFQEDPDLLGGLRVQLGGRLFDGSIRGRIERLRREWLGEA